jgi:hypothetical protein
MSFRIRSLYDSDMDGYYAVNDRALRLVNFHLRTETSFLITADSVYLGSVSRPSIFKELIMHVRNETSDKELKAGKKTKYKKLRQRGMYTWQSMFQLMWLSSIVNWMLSKLRCQMRMPSSVWRVSRTSGRSQHAFRTRSRCILVHGDAILKRSAEDLGSVILTNTRWIPLLRR